MLHLITTKCKAKDTSTHYGTASPHPNGHLPQRLPLHLPSNSLPSPLTTPHNASPLHRPPTPTRPRPPTAPSPSPLQGSAAPTASPVHSPSPPDPEASTPPLSISLSDSLPSPMVSLPSISPSPIIDLLSPYPSRSRPLHLPLQWHVHACRGGGGGGEEAVTRSGAQGLHQ